MTWQPIETAPLDGRKALVFRPLAGRTQDPKVCIAHLMKTNDWCWEATVPDGRIPCNPTDRSCHVTHWMPLPEAPE